MTSDRQEEEEAIKEQVAKEIAELETERKSNLKNIKADIIKLPAEMKEKELEVFGLNRALDVITASKKHLASVTFQKVCDATIMVESKKTDDDGKPEMVEKSAYTNDKSRDAETAKRLAQSTEYNELSDKELNTTKLIHSAKAEFDFLRRKLKVRGWLIEIIKLEKE